MTQDPICVAQGGEGVGAGEVMLVFDLIILVAIDRISVGGWGLFDAIPKIRGLKTGGAGSIDVQGVLEVLVEGIQEAVCEALMMTLSTMPRSCMDDIDCALHTHRKKRVVTKLRGHRLWRRVRVAAEVVLRLSTRRPDRFLRNSLTPILTGQECISQI